MSSMHNTCFALAVMAAFNAAAAQTPFKFQFKQGEPLLYKTSHETRVEVLQNGETVASASNVRQVKRWDVLKVDSLGVATLQLSLDELVLEQTEPSGEVLRFDSNNVDDSHPQLAEKLKQIVAKPILEVQIDAAGQLKHFKHLTDRQDALRELPFQVSVPTDRLPAKGVQWQRDFPIQLDPPLGNHETVRGVQRCSVASAAVDRIVLRVEHALLDPVEDPRRRMALVQFLPKGTVVLDPSVGRMIRAEMTVEETVADFDGEKGQYAFKSVYTEEFVPSLQQADRRD
jgi:hypothetical protein